MIFRWVSQFLYFFVIYLSFLVFFGFKNTLNFDIIQFWSLQPKTVFSPSNYENKKKQNLRGISILWFSSWNLWGKPCSWHWSRPTFMNKSIDNSMHDKWISFIYFLFCLLSVSAHTPNEKNRVKYSACAGFRTVSFDTHWIVLFWTSRFAMKFHKSLFWFIWYLFYVHLLCTFVPMSIFSVIHIVYLICNASEKRKTSSARKKPNTHNKEVRKKTQNYRKTVEISSAT